jgi:hypothetical protein
MNAPTSTMPQTVAEVYRPLWQELVNVHVAWRLFRQLFGTDEARVELLNRYAGGLFGPLYWIMYDDMIVSLFRLSDPMKTGKFENLSFDRLAEVVNTLDPALGNTLKGRSAPIDNLLAPFADWRDKRAAHNDLATAKARYLGSSSLQGPSRGTLEEILAEARALMNQVAVHYQEGETCFEEPIIDGGDGDSLVRHLVAYETLKKASRGF